MYFEMHAGFVNIFGYRPVGLLFQFSLRCICVVNQMVAVGVNVLLRKVTKKGGNTILLSI